MPRAELPVRRLRPSRLWALRPTITRSAWDYALDVAEALEILGVERFTLVGHSLGGAVATAVAELMPDRTDALILLAPVGFGRVHLAEAASIPGVDALLRATLPWALSSRAVITACYVTMVTNGRLPPADLVERVTTRGRHLVPGTREAIRAIAAAGRSSAAFHRRRVDYGGPVIAIWGDRDRLVPPSHQAGVRTAFPQARVELWQGMGHHPIHERLNDLAALIASAGAPRRAPSRKRPALSGNPAGQGRRGIEPSVERAA